MALLTDYREYVNKRSHGIQVPTQVAKSIFLAPQTYPINERLAERVTWMLQSMGRNNIAAHTAAPRFYHVLSEYIEQVAKTPVPHAIGMQQTRSVSHETSNKEFETLETRHPLSQPTPSSQSKLLGQSSSSGSRHAKTDFKSSTHKKYQPPAQPTKISEHPNGIVNGESSNTPNQQKPVTKNVPAVQQAHIPSVIQSPKRLKGRVTHLNPKANNITQVIGKKGTLQIEHKGSSIIPSSTTVSKVNKPPLVQADEISYTRLPAKGGRNLKYFGNTIAVTKPTPIKLSVRSAIPILHAFNIESHYRSEQLENPNNTTTEHLFRASSQYLNDLGEYSLIIGALADAPIVLLIGGAIVTKAGLDSWKEYAKNIRNIDPKTIRNDIRYFKSKINKSHWMMPKIKNELIEEFKNGSERLRDMNESFLAQDKLFAKPFDWLEIVEGKFTDSMGQLGNKLSPYLKNYEPKIDGVMNLIRWIKDSAYELSVAAGSELPFAMALKARSEAEKINKERVQELITDLNKSGHKDINECIALIDKLESSQNPKEILELCQSVVRENEKVNLLEGQEFKTNERGKLILGVIGTLLNIIQTFKSISTQKLKEEYKINIEKIRAEMALKNIHETPHYSNLLLSHLSGEVKRLAIDNYEKTYVTALRYISEYRAERSKQLERLAHGNSMTKVTEDELKRIEQSIKRKLNKINPFEKLCKCLTGALLFAGFGYGVGFIKAAAGAKDIAGGFSLGAQAISFCFDSFFKEPTSKNTSKLSRLQQAVFSEWQYHHANAVQAEQQLYAMSSEFILSTTNLAIYDFEKTSEENAENISRLKNIIDEANPELQKINKDLDVLNNRKKLHKEDRKRLRELEEKKKHQEAVIEKNQALLDDAECKQRYMDSRSNAYTCANKW